MASGIRKLAALSVIALTLVAGCGTPGVDGDLTDDWGTFAEPEPMLPEVGDCHGSETNAVMALYERLDCAESHTWETFHVGTFTGEAADRVGPPPHGGAERVAAFEECSGKADGFLGGDWHDGRVTIRVIQPSQAAWAAGSRWFRCDLAQADRIGAEDARVYTDRSGSLRDALAADAPLARGCYRLESDYDAAPVPCEEPHELEYVGTWDASKWNHQDLVDQPKVIARQCLSLAAKYVGVPRIASMTTDAALPSMPDWTSWDDGDRGVRCHLMLGKELRGSTKGAGAEGLAELLLN